MLKTLFHWLRIAADLLIPRFITEDVALERCGLSNDWRSFELVCAMRDVEPGERFDGIAEVDSFTWLGVGLTYRIGNFRHWPT